MTNKEKLKILQKYFGNENGDIDLSYIKLGKKNIYLYSIETTGNIDNGSQKANYIKNEGQQAVQIINNSYQSSDLINNSSQKGDRINNNDQDAFDIFNVHQNMDKAYY